VHETIVVMSDRGLGAGLILRALIDNLAVVDVEPVHISDLPPGSGGDMQALDAMQVGQCKGKAFSLFERDKRIDIDRMNRLRTLVIATVVAKGGSQPQVRQVRKISAMTSTAGVVVAQPRACASHQAPSAF
jgi:hypothetical protein